MLHLFSYIDDSNRRLRSKFIISNWSDSSIMKSSLSVITNINLRVLCLLKEIYSSHIIRKILNLNL